jgi:hypothetical protein
MKRTQLYLNDDVWKALHIQSKQQGISISELVRQAVREKYLNSAESRTEAMEALVGLRKDRKGLPDTDTYIRRLRTGKRLRTLKS